MSAKIILRKKEYEVKPGQTLAQVMKQINAAPESYLATRSGEMMTEDEMVKEGDIITLIAVISGGGAW
jgi:sulfur carrier protein ThiS